MTFPLIAGIIVFLSLGIVFVSWPSQAGIAFCRLGKSIWKISTFGLTDMHWFYREDKAPERFRRMGVFFILFGILFAVIVGFSFSGPNSLAAIREAGNYLHEKYGSSGGSWKLSAHAEGSDSNVEIVDYRYSNFEGHLRAVWTGHNYTFSEIQ